MYRVKITFHDGAVRFLTDEMHNDIHNIGEWAQDGIAEFLTMFYAVNAAVNHAVEHKRYRNADLESARGIWEIEQRDDNPRWIAVD